eukprot:TRINITY_DN271_c0_g1_i6.p1 TRINITY_DN271_c0_g1~~TRINITY_DN271_c0_g1_i6.p1  ORF type:complete len:103 (-),score=11.87 TRINITY_DN271_c0_g1_i6:562-870(-)
MEWLSCSRSRFGIYFLHVSGLGNLHKKMGKCKSRDHFHILKVVLRRVSMDHQQRLVFLSEVPHFFCLFIGAITSAYYASSALNSTISSYAIGLVLDPATLKA